MVLLDWMEWILSYLPKLPRRQPRRGGRRQPSSPKSETGARAAGDKVHGNRISKSPSASPKSGRDSRNVSQQSSPIKTSQEGLPGRSIGKGSPTTSPKGSPVKSDPGRASLPVGQRPDTAAPGEEITLDPPGDPPKEDAPVEDPDKPDPAGNEDPKSESSTSEPPPAAPDNAWNKWPAVVDPDTKGLANPGNFCYRNATLQALFHVPGFYRYMVDVHTDCSVANGYYLKPAAYKHAPSPVKHLDAFNLACRRSLPKFEIFKDLRTEFLFSRQADAYDFLVYLLDQIEGKLQDEEKALFAEMFEMRQQETWTCKDCGTERKRPISLEEARAGLDIAIQPRASKDTLVEYLQEDFRAQTRAQKCDSNTCKNQSKLQEKEGPTREVTKQIVSAPQILVIRLKRFVQTPIRTLRSGPQRFTDSKLDTHVDFEEFLDLSEFTQSNEDCLYRLEGVVGHAGKSIRSGHYLSAVRVNLPDTEEAKFQIVNDDRVIGMTKLNNGNVNEMKYPTSQGTTASPYILVYSKISSAGNI